MSGDSKSCLRRVMIIGGLRAPAAPCTKIINRTVIYVAFIPIDGVADRSDRIKRLSCLQDSLLEIGVSDTRRGHEIDRSPKNAFESLLHAEVAAEMVESRTDVELHQDIDIAGFDMERIIGS